MEINKTTNRLSVMERAVRDMLTEGKAIWIPDEKVDMSIFSQYARQKEGIAVYYPVFKDGSCANVEYIRFYRSASGMSIEFATKHDFDLQEKERIGFLLRR